ncbi:hypothetical protein [Streptococcus gallolyticus]|uniref:hypothetical protein n=1 Tax=Streptococcus gallolyticus TaxID=315405 RepID=UPI0015F3311A|nr:hypothetical protein [Streptococcus gallolyticus]
MKDKEKLIADFEACYWVISPEVRSQLLRLPLGELILKIVEWQNWAEIGGKIEF